MGTVKSGMSLDALVGAIEAIRIRYLGLGFIWAWVYCAWDTALLFPERQGLSINADSTWLISAIAVVLGLFCGAMAKKRIASMLHSRGIAVAAGLCALGTMLCGVMSQTPGIPLSAIIGGALTGIGCALLYLMWARVYASLDDERAETSVPISAAVPLLFMLVAPTAGAELFNWILVASLPLISGAMLFFSVRDLNDGPDASPRHRGGDETDVSPHGGMAPGIFGRTCVTLILSYACLCFLAATLDQGELDLAIEASNGIDVSTFLASIVGLVMAVLCIGHSVRIDLPGVFRWIMPLMMATLVASFIGTPEANLASLCGQSIVNVMLEIIVFLYLTNLARKQALSPEESMGWGWGSCQLGILIGNLAGAEALSGFSNPEYAGAALLALAFVFSVGYAFLPPRERLMMESSEQLAQDDSEPSMEDEHPQALKHVQPSSESIDFVALGVDHGLTPRESEVFSLLARGRSLPYIRERLYISKNTAAGHVKNIYRKLDVHSKQELLDLVESWNSDTASKG